MVRRIGFGKMQEKTKNSNKTNYIHFNEHKKEVEIERMCM